MEKHKCMSIVKWKNIQIEIYEYKYFFNNREKVLIKYQILNMYNYKLGT